MIPRCISDRPDVLAAEEAFLDIRETPVPGLVSADLSDAIDHARRLEWNFRHSFWRERRQATYHVLHDLAARGAIPAARAQAFAACGRHATVLRHRTERHRYRVACWKCHDRLCEACQTERRRILCRNLMRQLADRGRIRLLTLTLRSSDHPLSQQIDRIYDCFRQFRRDPRIRPKMDGGLAFLELTRNEQTGLWHPHLHVLFTGDFLPHRLARAVWEHVTQDSYIVDVRSLTTPKSAATYVAKYASKALSPRVWRDPNALAEAALALCGRRTFLAFGSWTKMSLSRPDPTDDTADDWEEVGTLAEILTRANAGDEDARAIVRALRREDAARRGEAPPHEWSG